MTTTTSATTTTMDSYTLISMNPHTRTRDDLVDQPGVHDVTHTFRCLQRSGKSSMQLVIVITAYNEPWFDKDGGDMRSTSTSLR